jgi:hypothetical protein
MDCCMCVCVCVCVDLCISIFMPVKDRACPCADVNRIVIHACVFRV